MKADGQIFGVRRLLKPLSKEQSFRLRQIAEFLTFKLADKSNNYKNIFNLPLELEEEL